MQITRQADYAVRAMVYLAQLGPDRRAATSQIAKEKQIPPSFLAKIVSQLSVAGLLQTSRGARGGVSLAKPAEQITLLDVVEAIDGPILLNECVSNAGACQFSVLRISSAAAPRRNSSTSISQPGKDIRDPMG